MGGSSRQIRGTLPDFPERNVTKTMYGETVSGTPRRVSRTANYLIATFDVKISVCVSGHNTLFIRYMKSGFCHWVVLLTADHVVL